MPAWPATKIRLPRKSKITGAPFMRFGLDF
jgi:hypothetical protein